MIPNVHGNQGDTVVLMKDDLKTIVEFVALELDDGVTRVSGGHGGAGDYYRDDNSGSG